MKIHEEDFQAIPEENRLQWEQLKEEVVVQGSHFSIEPLFWKSPTSIEHSLSLFPNNFLDVEELSNSEEQLKGSMGGVRKLLKNTKITERNISNFIKDNKAYFIMGSIIKNEYRFGHHSLYIFPEFPLMPNYRVDYLLVGENSDGYHFVFVELENPYHNITLRDGSFGTTIRKGIRQVEDWKIWLEAHFSHLRLVFEEYQNKKFPLPKEFCIFDETRIHFVVIAGRRTDYKDKTNRLCREYRQDRKISVVHYDNLLDYSNETIETLKYR
jgi:hypothetical protein